MSAARTRYPRYAPNACEAITTTGNECRYLGIEERDVMDGNKRPRTVRLCRVHTKALDNTARHGGWYTAAWALTVRQDGEDVDVWPLVGSKAGAA